MQYSDTQDLNKIISFFFFCSLFLFVFFIPSGMPHITVNWTLVWCLLTEGFTSDPEAWFKQKKNTEIPPPPTHACMQNSAIGLKPAV